MTVVVGIVVRCLLRRAGECASRASIASLRARGHIVQVFCAEFFPLENFSRRDRRRFREKRRDHHPGANDAAKREEEEEKKKKKR